MLAASHDDEAVSNAVAGQQGDGDDEANTTLVGESVIDPNVAAITNKSPPL